MFDTRLRRLVALQEYAAALALIAANRVADGLDGALARASAPTDLGGYLDVVCDFLFYSAVPFAFAVGRPGDALPAAFLVFSFVGTGSSFLAYATIAAKRQAPPAPGKAFRHLGGLTEGAETIALFVAICVWPDRFAVLAWSFGGLCWLTTATRVGTAVSAFRNPPRSA